jgi:homoaconitase/3-isopropylmalate dehydratase large subunit
VRLDEIQVNVTLRPDQVKKLDAGEPIVVNTSTVGSYIPVRLTMIKHEAKIYREKKVDNNTE